MADIEHEQARGGFPELRERPRPWPHPIGTARDLRRDLALAWHPAEVYEAFVRWCEGEGLAPVGAYLFSPDGHHPLDPDWPNRADAPLALGTPDHDGTAGCLALRVAFAGRALGVVLFERSGLLAEDAVAAVLDTEVAPALLRTRCLADTLRDNVRLRANLNYLEAMGSLLGQREPELLLLNILEITCDHVGADAGSLTLVTGDGSPETIVDWGLPHQTLVSVRLRDGTRALDRVLATRRPLLLRRDELDARVVGAIGAERLLLVPLCARDRVVGSINLIGPRSVASLTAEALAATNAGAAVAAAAVEYALHRRSPRGHADDRRGEVLARQVEAALRPGWMPSCDGLDVAGARVAGNPITADYFDHLELADGRLGLVVAELDGPGIAPGLTMATVRAHIRSAARRHGDPAPLLTEVNATLAAEPGSRPLVSAVCAAVDGVRGRLRVASAGPLSPLLLRSARGEVQECVFPSPLIAQHKDTVYRAHTVDMDRDDAIVLFTHGLLGAGRNTRHAPVKGALGARLRAGAHRPAVELVRTLLATMSDRLEKSPPPDGVAIVVARRT